MEPYTDGTDANDSGSLTFASESARMRVGNCHKPLSIHEPALSHSGPAKAAKYFAVSDLKTH